MFAQWLSCIMKPKKINTFMDFTKPNPILYDGVIIVEDTKFYVNKKTLARISPVLNEMFFEDPESDELHFDDVKKEDLQFFLEASHGALFLDDARVVGVYRLSHKWKCVEMLEECLQFFDKESKVPTYELLRLGVETNSEFLKKIPLAKIHFVEEFNSVVPEDIDSIQNPEVTLLLFKEAMRFHRPPPLSPETARRLETVKKLLDFIEETSCGGPLPPRPPTPGPNPEYIRMNGQPWDLDEELNRELENMEHHRRNVEYLANSKADDMRKREEEWTLAEIRRLKDSQTRGF